MERFWCIHLGGFQHTLSACVALVLAVIVAVNCPCVGTMDAHFGGVLHRNVW